MWGAGKDVSKFFREVISRLIVGRECIVFNLRNVSACLRW
jgi:hypothetical protein